MSGIKRDKRDAVFSNLVRERANWVCERCGKACAMTPTAKMGYHCAHLFSRRGRSTRWHPDNAICACYGCHQYIDSHQAAKEELARKILGNERYDFMVRLAATPVQYKNWELDALYTHLKDEYKSMIAKRKEGNHTYIQFKAYKEF